MTPINICLHAALLTCLASLAACGPSEKNDGPPANQQQGRASGVKG